MKKNTKEEKEKYLIINELVKKLFNILILIIIFNISKKKKKIKNEKYFFI